MNEKEWNDLLHERLSKIIKDYKVLKKENLLYQMIINAYGDLQPENYNKPTRGNYAFQTDILIKDDKIPLCVLELKVDGFSTHDILTYSQKAKKHKEIYPYLRYGLIILEKNKIDRRFFLHNQGFDFAFAMKDISKLDELTQIIKKQLKYARILSLALRRSIRYKKYETCILTGSSLDD